MKQYHSLANALTDLKERGYESDFEPQSDCLYCSNLDLRLNEEEFHVDEAYRFKTDADPANNIVVYALTSPTGVKGTVVDELAASSETTSLDMAKKLQKQLATAGT